MEQYYQPSRLCIAYLEMRKRLQHFRITSSQYLHRIREHFLISDIIAALQNFKIVNSLVMHRIWKDWQRVAPAVDWKLNAYTRGSYLAGHSIWMIRIIFYPGKLSQIVLKELSKEMDFSMGRYVGHGPGIPGLRKIAIIC